MEFCEIASVAINVAIRMDLRVRRWMQGWNPWEDKNGSTADGYSGDDNAGRRLYGDGAGSGHGKSVLPVAQYDDDPLREPRRSVLHRGDARKGAERRGDRL